MAGKRDQDEHLPNTYPGSVPVNTITGEVISLFDATRDTTRETTQFEVRYATDFDGPVNFVAGAFQQTNDAAFCVVQVLGFIDFAFDLRARSALPQNLNNNTPQVLCNKQDSDSLAGYIDVSWDVTDQFSLAAGYRETRDERSWAGRTQVAFDVLDDNDGMNGIAVLGGLQRPAAGRKLQQVSGRHHRQPEHAGLREPVGDLDGAELARRRFVQVHRRIFALRHGLARLQGGRLQRPDRDVRPDGVGTHAPGRSGVRDEL